MKKEKQKSKNLKRIFFLLLCATILFSCKTAKVIEKKTISNENKSIYIDTSSDKNINPLEKIVLSLPEKNEKFYRFSLDENLQSDQSALSKTTEKKDITNMSQLKENNKNSVNLNAREENFTNNNSKLIELELKTIKVEEGDNFSISIENNGWILKEPIEKQIELIKRENYEKSTIFQFRAKNIGTAEIMLLRYDIEKNLIFRQPVSIKISVKNEKKTAINSSKKSEKEKTVDDKIKEEANQLFLLKRYNEAKTLYLDIENNNNADSEVYYKLGIIEKELGNNSYAIEYFKKATTDKNSPFFSIAAFELIKILRDQKKLMEAIDFYSRTINISNFDPKYQEDFLMLIADIYYQFGDFSSSTNEYRRFMNLFPNSKNFDKALFYLALSLESLKLNPSYKEAYFLYKKLIEQYPESKYYMLSKNRMLYLDRHFLKIN